MSSLARATDAPPCLRALRRWALSGATQHPSGAMAGWRDAGSGRLSSEYPEITGYLLTYWSGAPEESGVAQRAARWLADRVWVGNLAGRGCDGLARYNFDLGMMATGLMSAGAVMAKDEYVAAGVILANHLRRQVNRHGGLAALDPLGGPCSRPPAWSTVGCAHLVKAVQAFLLADCCGESGMVDAGAALIDGATTVTGPDTDVVWLHPLLYAAEGFWVWAAARHDDRAMAVARRLVEEAWRAQLPNGGFPAAAGPATLALEQGDVLAQAVRMSVLTALVPEKFDRALRRLDEITYRSPQGRAVVYRPGRTDVHENTWATLFAVQAMQLAFEQTTLPWTALV